MSREIALTILVPLCIVSISLLALAILTKLKRRRTRRVIERGLTDFVHQVRKKNHDQHARAVEGLIEK